ncbi:hypothetical protein ACJMK2_039369 [Sinanodonta woodiana]|uniref:Ral guanine nucleotide dissociation stimulator n=1 Tax=Sinanodonta woodiana TaxID=1069815 RepID=A0ABD3WBX6_SINWO
MELGRQDNQDDVTRFWREEREEGAVYHAYLKKVTYHTLAQPECEEGNEFSRLMWETQKIRVIKAGTLERLAESLITSKGELDSTFVNVFFATYRTYTTPEKVLQLLTERYKSLKNGKKDADSELNAIRQRAIKSVISVWFDTYPEDFREPPDYPCLHTLEQFAKNYVPDSDLAIRAQHKIEKFQKELAGKRDAGIGFNSFCEEVDQMILSDYHQPLNFGDIPNQHFAEQLTYRDAELFKRVVPHHCLGAVWARRTRKNGRGGTVAGSVLATIEQFNRVSLRVIATVLKHPDLKTSQRAKIIQKWIDIAHELRNLKNFSSLKAIISGLQAHSVYRLRKTWLALPKESLDLFEELSGIFSNENNQMVSRNLLMKEATAKFPEVDSSNKILRRRNIQKRQSWIEHGIVQGTVPYLGTFLTDLTMIDTAVPDMTEDNLINFDKRRKEFEVLAQIKLLQSASQIYHLEEDRHFWLWFDSVRVYDENESCELSIAIEPIQDSAGKMKKKSATMGHRPSKVDTNRFSLFMCGGMNFEDKSGLSSGASTLGDSPVSPTPGMSHSSSTSSLFSYDSDYSSPFKLSDGCVIKVGLESSPGPSTHVYKSIMLHNTDHTHTVIKRVLDKYDCKERPEDFSLLQILSDGEFLIPESANVFYAMNNSGDVSFVVRSKKAQEAINSHRKHGKIRLKKLSL